MSEEREDDEDWGYDDGFDGDDGFCECDGSGVIVTCIDDMCRGAGYCIHGDGEKLCRCSW